MKKALPKTTKPLFDLRFPSKNTTVKARPFLVKEEKILLIGGEGGSEKEITNAIKQVLHNCVQDRDFSVNDLTIFDLEFMFLKLRARSVNNIIDVSYRDIEDNKVYDFQVNLDDVILKEGDANKKVEINDTTGIIMKYPSVSILDNAPEDLTPTGVVEYLIRNCIEQIYDADDVYLAEEYTDAELDEFIEELEPTVFQKIREYFENIPQLYHKIEYENSLGNKRTIELTTLNDFFTWG